MMTRIAASSYLFHSVSASGKPKMERWHLQMMKSLLMRLDYFYDAKEGDVTAPDAIASSAASFCTDVHEALNWIKGNVKLSDQQRKEVEKWATESHDFANLANRQMNRVAPLTYTEITRLVDFADDVVDFIEDHFKNSPRSTANQHKVPGSKMVLINAGGFDKEVIKACMRILKKTVAQLKKTKSEYLAYGEVILTPPVMHDLNNQASMGSRVELLTKKSPKRKKTARKTSVAAYYTPMHDKVVLQATSESLSSSSFLNKRFFADLIHELGHRIEYKFKSRLNSDFKKTYNEGKKALKSVGVGASMMRVYDLGLYQFVSPYSTSNASEMLAEAFCFMNVPEEFTKDKALQKKHLAALAQYYKA